MARSLTPSSADPEAIIGQIDASKVRERSDGLFVAGQLDLEGSELARGMRLVEQDLIGLSFGFLVEEDRARPDGVRELLKLDLYEISLTATPTNADTRILSSKSARSATDRQRAELAALTTGIKTHSERAPIQVASFEVR